MGAAADGAGGAVRQTLGQQARLRVEKGPLEVVAEGVGALLCAVGEKIALLRLPCGLPPVLPLGEAPGQLREGRLPPGQLFGPGLKAHLLGLRAPKGGEALLQSRQLSVQLPEGGAALFGSGVLEGGGVPGGRKLLFEAVQPVEGREVRFRPLELSGQRVQRGGISGVAGRFGLGGVQNGPQSVLPGLRGGQLEAELLGLFGPAQRLLELVQLCLSPSPGGGGGAQRLLLPGQQGVQKGQHPFRRRLPARLAEGGQLVQNGSIGVPLGPAQAGEQLPDADALLLPLAGEGGVLGLQPLLETLVGLGAEQLAEDLAPLLGGGVEQPGELPLGDHGDLGELVVVQPDDVHHGGGDVLGPGDGRTAVGVGEAGVGLFGGEALAPGFRAEVFGVAADGAALSPHLEFQLHEGGGAGLGVLAAEHGPFPDAAAGMVVEGVGDGVEEGGLARAGVAGDEVEPASAQLGEVQNGLGGIRPEGRQGQFQGSHASSSFQMSSMSDWQNAACSSERGWPFWAS